MFNPFKKKDNEFKLDEISLPNFSDDSNSLPQMPDNLPNQDLGSTPQMPELPSLDNNNNNFQSDLNSNPMNNQFAQNSFDGSSSTNPMLNPESLNETNENTQNNQNSEVHHEIAKAQLETIMSKINLLDARQQNMEQKIEMIYQLILSEVSEDTKRKLNVQSMMGKIKN